MKKLIKNRQTKFLDALGILPSPHENPGHLFSGDAPTVLLLFWSWLYLVASIGFALFCLCVDIFFTNELFLFQRSGAVVVAAGSYIQYIMPDKYLWFDERVLKATLYASKGYDSFFRLSNIFYKISWLAIILGSILWAYGDLLIVFMRTY